MIDDNFSTNVTDDISNCFFIDCGRINDIKYTQLCLEKIVIIVSKICACI